MMWDAIVLAGGRARRMDDADKAQVEVGGRTLLDRTLDAVGQAQKVIVVGPGPVPDGVELVREDPPFGGPAAGVIAALPAVESEWVLVAACDHPFVAEAVPRLVAERDGGDGVVLESPGGRRQLVLLARTAALRSAATEFPDPTGLSMGALLATLDLRAVVGSDRTAADVDTWADVQQAEGHIDG